MAQLKFGAAGVSAREIDLSGPVAQPPVGVPAGIIGTALKGPAFVPVTVGLVSDFYAKFGATDGQRFGPLAVTEWLRNAQAVTYLRVLGAGDGKQRNSQTGIVNEAGFVVGEKQPDPDNDGVLSANPYAVLGGPAGRTYFLGCFMSESAGSTVFSSAGLQSGSAAQPIVRGVLMAPSGVILTLSTSVGTSLKPTSTAVATNGNGASVGAAVLMQGSVAKQDFVLLLNGHKGTDPLYPNVITASFDMTSPNYFANVLNTDPTKLQQAGHYVYAAWDVHPSTALVTGEGVLTSSMVGQSIELAAFLLTGSQARDTGTATAPDFENFRDRFNHAATPWVISQPFGGRAQNLFKVHALDDGTGVSTLYKLSIENIAPSTDGSNLYPSFDLVVRAWNDNDGSPNYLEQWRGLSLNPGDDRYIAKVIGDQYAYFDFDRGPTAQKLAVDGNYPNQSNYIRIEVDPSVDSGEADPTAMPVGVRGPYHLMTAGTDPLKLPVSSYVIDSAAWTRVKQPPLPLRQNMTQGSGAKLQVNPQLYWGVQFEHVASLTTPNLSTLQNKSLNAYAKHFPNHRIDVQTVLSTDNAGTPSTTANGVIDNDLFNLNVFTLMNVKVTTGSAGTADPNKWVNATYVRDGNIAIDDANKTRGLLPTDFIQANRRYLKWSFLIQGGFDGVNIFDLDEARLTSTAVEGDMADSNRGSNLGATVSAYAKALQIMGEVTNTDLQLLAIPGIRNPVITDAAITAMETRFDALYLMDIEQIDNDGALVTSDTQLPSVTLTAQNFAQRALDSSFAAAYFPDVVLQDPTTKTNVVVPPSVVVLGALALNDAVGHPWFAPAGFTRGALQTTLEARVALSKTNMDVLYDVNVNPLVAFPGNATGGTNPKGGVVVWGQKTLQQAASALDRVNVRRLLIEIRRQVRDIANTILFEPNRDVTLAKFSAAVTPRLQRIQALAGLERFKVVIDSSTTSQQDIENNTIRGKIFVQPTKSIEYVSLDFVVTNNLNQQVP
jgi:phage tail sheath protein FI